MRRQIAFGAALLSPVLLLGCESFTANDLAKLTPELKQSLCKSVLEVSPRRGDKFTEATATEILANNEFRRDPNGLDCPSKRKVTTTKKQAKTS